MKVQIAAVLVIALGAVGCSSNPAAPTEVNKGILQETMDFAINIPDRILVSDLNVRYPQGVWVSPMSAQVTWDYSAQYGGSPNVYYGPLPGGQNTYQGVGITIAPTSVASEATFMGSEWPAIGLVSTARYSWVGRFVYVQYQPDINAPRVTLPSPPAPARPGA